MTDRALIARCKQLERALLAFMKEEQRMARDSYSRFDGRRRIFNDVIWEQADPNGYNLWKTGRDLLRGRKYGSETES